MADIAIETGIAPSLLMDETPEMFRAICDALVRRAKAREKANRQRGRRK